MPIAIAEKKPESSGFFRMAHATVRPQRYHDRSIHLKETP